MRRVLLATATVVGTALSPAVVAAAAPDPGGTAATGIVRLVTGDRAILTPIAGRPAARIIAAEPTGITGSFERLQLGGHAYVIPAEARPFLGGLLDPSLFDVTRLAAVERTGRLPVSLTMTNGAAVRLPGFSLATRRGTTARGWLSGSGAATIRAALVRAWRAATGPQHRFPTALFGNVSRLALAPASALMTPSYPQVTLIVRVRGANGELEQYADVILINTDDLRRYAAFVPVIDGEARVSVPLGHYSAVTEVPDSDPVTGDFVDRLVPVADYRVTANLQKLTLSAASATAEPGVTTPRPANVAVESVELDRSDRAGRIAGISFSYMGSGFHVFVAPTPWVHVGRLHWLTGWQLLGEAAQSARPYSYDLSFAAHGHVPADQRHHVRTADLATVRSTYYNDPSRESQFERVPIYPFQYFISATFLPVDTPTVRTEYVTGGGHVGWYASLIADPTEDEPFAGLLDDDRRVYGPGTHRRASWQRGLLAPGFAQPSAADRHFYCPACRTKTRLVISLAPLTDTTPGHVGDILLFGKQTATRFALYRNGRKVAAETNRTGTQVAVPAGKARYRLHLAVDRGYQQVRTATAMTTDLTFVSSARNGGALPASWHCPFPHARTCTALPALTARLALPTDLTGRIGQGRATASLTIAPFDPAISTRITSAAVFLSTGGKFSRAPLLRTANGEYRVTLRNPASAAGRPVTLRIAATDARGDRIVQTTRAAYLVAGR